MQLADYRGIISPVANKRNKDSKEADPGLTKFGRPVDRRGKPKKRKQLIPPLDSSLASVFQHLEGGWPSYINYVKVAANDGDDGDKDMQKLVETYDSLPTKRRQQITPEQLCLESGVSIKKFIAGVMPWIWMYSQTAKSVFTAIASIPVLKKTAAAALGQGKNAHKDRETFLKISGDVPTSQGSRTVIHNNPTAIAGANSQSSGLPIRLPSAASALLELEAVDQDDPANDSDVVTTYEAD